MLLLEVLPHTSHCSNTNRMEWEGLLRPMHFKLHCLFLSINRCRSGCKKKRSFHTNSFFAEFPCIPLGTLLLAIYHFDSEDSWRQTVQRLNLKPGMVSKIYQWLRDVCSRDLDERPFTPFGRPRTAVKCDESKFNHKAKVRTLNKCQKLWETLEKKAKYTFANFSKILEEI